MGIERRTQVIPANGRLEIGRGNLFILFAATAAVNLRLERSGNSEGFDNITGGIRVQRLNSWDFAVIIGAPGTTVQWITGSENVVEDKADVFLQVTTVAGTVAVASAPTTTFTTPVDVLVGAGASSDIAANPLRRAITIGADVANADPLPLRVRDQAAVTEAGIQLQAGMSVRLETIAAIRIRNNGAVGQTYSISEET